MLRLSVGTQWAVLHTSASVVGAGADVGGDRYEASAWKAPCWDGVPVSVCLPNDRPGPSSVSGTCGVQDTRQALHPVTTNQSAQVGPAVRSELTQLLLAQAPVALVVNVALASILAWVLSDRMPGRMLAAWYGLVVFITAVRALLILAYRKTMPSQAQVWVWRSLILAMTIVSGIVWGSAGILFTPKLSLEFQVLLAFVLGGMSAGAVPVLASAFAAYAVYVAAVLVPIIAWFLTQWTETYLAMGVMGLVYMAALLTTAWNYHRQLAISLTLGFENAHLVSGLKYAKEITEETNRRLEAEVAERARVEQEIRRSRQSLRNLMARLDKVREEERSALSHEVHDELGQLIARLKMDLVWVGNQLPKEDRKSRDRVQEAVSLTERAFDAVRQISSRLRPAVLDDIGLEAALEWQVKEFAARTGCQFQLDLETQDLDLEAEMATAVFRILQEALTNVARHAEAGHVRVRLAHVHDELVLEVQDDGHGVADHQVNDTQSLGLIGMRERAVRLGGHVRIVQGEDGGTLVDAMLPLKRRAALSRSCAPPTRTGKLPRADGAS